MKSIGFKLINIIVLLVIFLASCKKDQQLNVPKSSKKLLKYISTNDNNFYQNFIVNYNKDGFVSYVGSSDFTNGYHYKYLGVKIVSVKHQIGDLQYDLALTYSANETLSGAEFKVKNAFGVVTTFPLVCTQSGNVTLVSSNADDLTFLQLELSDAELIKARTNAWYLKSSINFQYNKKNGRILGNVVPIAKLNNPINPAAAIKVNELISLFLQAYSSKQLIAFHAQQFLGKINYMQSFDDLTVTECTVDNVDNDGNLIKTTKTTIHYSYVYQ